MIDATISCGRMRGLARLGRVQGSDARLAALGALSASCAERLTEATGIAESLGSRPGVDDLMASII